MQKYKFITKPLLVARFKSTSKASLLQTTSWSD